MHKRSRYTGTISVQTKSDPSRKIMYCKRVAMNNTQYISSVTVASCFCLPFLLELLSMDEPMRGKRKGNITGNPSYEHAERFTA